MLTNKVVALLFCVLVQILCFLSDKITGSSTYLPRPSVHPSLTLVKSTLLFVSHSRLGSAEKTPRVEFVKPLQPTTATAWDSPIGT